MDVDEAWKLAPGTRVRRRADARTLVVVRVLPWSEGPLVWCAERPSAHPEPWTPAQLERIEDETPSPR